MEYMAKQSVDLPVTDYLELEFYLMDARPGIKPDAFVTELVHRWLAVEKERLALSKNGPTMRGYQWKNLFLPDGTQLRTCHLGVIEYAKVNGDCIVAEDGATLTPSRFANRHGAGRNAWRSVWIRYPGEAHWRRAANCRACVDDLGLQRSKTTIPMSRAV